MLKIGLTGGIGSGKSIASGFFAEFGAEIVDTDQLSRELVRPGRPALAEIKAAFGEQILSADGQLNRARLRTMIFTDPADRRRVEAILHPKIRTEMLARAERSTAPYVVFVIPLLFETDQQGLVDRVLVIDAPEALQRTRVIARDQMDSASIDRILEAQTDRATRLRGADDVICNDGSLSEFRAALQRLHRKYCAQATE